MLEKIKKLLGLNKHEKGNRERLILIVEDNEVDRKIVEHILVRQGFQTLKAKDGKKGLEAVQKNRPDLILLDCEMPNMGGVEMCRELKANPDTDDIPVLFLTSVDTPKNIIDCFELDAENYIHKPISAKVLMPAIREILSKRSLS